jgi:serine/threonine-protein kinase
VAGVVLGGWLVGYGIAAFVLFPAPERPDEFVAVPDLREQSETEARARLADLGLTLEEVHGLRHPEADSGRVVGQAPLPGQSALPGGGVRMVVSLGPDRRPVPALSRLRVDRAVDLLRATGFEVVADSVESDLPRGRVLSVEPAEGTPVALPGEVALTVSLGPPVVAMPDLLGMDIGEARDSLSSLGLVVAEVEEVFRFGRDQGRVVEQDPASETELQRGSAVRVTIGRRGG